MYGWGNARDSYSELRTFNASAPMASCKGCSFWKALYLSIFYLNLAAAAQMVCFKISRTYHYSFFLRVIDIILTRRTCMRTAGMPCTRTGRGASAASLFLAAQFARFYFSFLVWCNLDCFVYLLIDSKLMHLEEDSVSCRAPTPTHRGRLVSLPAINFGLRASMQYSGRIMLWEVKTGLKETLCYIESKIRFFF